jgi:hypothetical protein
MTDDRDYWKEDAGFPRFLTVEETARSLGVLTEWVSWWIGQGKLPIAARSEYAGFLLRTYTVETVGRRLAETAPPGARLSDPNALVRRDPPPGPALPVGVERMLPRRGRAEPLVPEKTKGEGFLGSVNERAMKGDEHVGKRFSEFPVLQRE